MNSLLELLKRIEAGQHEFEPDHDTEQSLQDFQSTVRLVREAEAAGYLLAKLHSCADMGVGYVDSIFIIELTHPGRTLLK